MRDCFALRDASCTLFFIVSVFFSPTRSGDRDGSERANNNRENCKKNKEVQRIMMSQFVKSTNN